MIDFASRIEDVVTILTSDFGVNDRLAIELLLAAQITAPTPYPWLILETDCHSLSLSAEWFAFGSGQVFALPQYRMRRPRLANLELMKILSDQEGPQLFIEPNFERPLKVNYRLHYWPYLMQICLRLRSPYPRSKPANSDILGRLQAATDRALDTQFRSEFPSPKTVPLPPSFLYFAELTQRASPYQRDWQKFVENLIAMAHRRAYLFNRPVEESDWQAVFRLMRESIPAWTTKILSNFAEGGSWHSLRGYYPESMMREEMRRLVEAGLVCSHAGRWRLTDYHQQGTDVVALVLGNVEL